MEDIDLKIEKLCKKFEKYCELYGKMKVINALNQVINIECIHLHSVSDLLDKHSNENDDNAEIVQKINCIRNYHNVLSKHGENNTIIFEVKENHHQQKKR